MIRGALLLWDHPNFCGWFKYWGRLHILGHPYFEVIFIFVVCLHFHDRCPLGSGHHRVKMLIA